MKEMASLYDARIGTLQQERKQAEEDAHRALERATAIAVAKLEAGEAPEGAVVRLEDVEASNQQLQREMRALRQKQSGLELGLEVGLDASLATGPPARNGNLHLNPTPPPKDRDNLSGELMEFQKRLADLRAECEEVTPSRIPMAHSQTLTLQECRNVTLTPNF